MDNTQFGIVPENTRPLVGSRVVFPVIAVRLVEQDRGESESVSGIAMGSEVTSAKTVWLPIDPRPGGMLSITATLIVDSLENRPKISLRRNKNLPEPTKPAGAFRVSEQFKPTHTQGVRIDTLSKSKVLHSAISTPAPATKGSVMGADVWSEIMVTDAEYVVGAVTEDVCLLSSTTDHNVIYLNLPDLVLTY
jgi:hypothetical protein